MTIKKLDIIEVDYEGTFDDGTVFDSSAHGDHSHPLQFQVGSGQVIPGFDNAVMGMKKGEEKTFTIKPEEGYGMQDDEFVKKIPRSSLPAKPEPEVGMTLVMNMQGHQVPGTIKSVEKDTLEVDFNHPLAGKTLHFKIKIVTIKPYSDNKEEQHAR
jgi:peptidylprolyl isomerase